MFNLFCSSLAVKKERAVLCVKRMVVTLWRGGKKVDCPLLLMCDLTSFANGNFNLGEGKSWTRAGGREHGVRFWWNCRRAGIFRTGTFLGNFCGIFGEEQIWEVKDWDIEPRVLRHTWLLPNCWCSLSAANQNVNCYINKCIKWAHCVL